MKLRHLLSPLLLMAGLASAQSLWTLGPTLHLNFGPGKWETSLGLEYGYWSLRPVEIADSRFAVGADVGIEFTRSKARLYTEAQTGLIGGISAGPYLEIPYSGAKADFGLQGSIWGAYLLGADLRGRIGTDGRTFSPGVFVKYIDCFDGPDECWN